MESITSNELTEEQLNDTVNFNQIENGSDMRDELDTAYSKNIESQIKLEPLEIEDSAEILNAKSNIESSTSKHARIHFCSLCLKTFLTIEECDAHKAECFAERNSRKENKFICPVCSYRCRCKWNLQRHVFRRHNPNAKQTTCKRCYNVFLTKSAFQRHQSKCTYEIKPNKIKGTPTECEICGVVQSSKYNLRKHQIRMHSAPGTQFCSICSKVFSNANDLEAHEIECTTKQLVSNMKRRIKKFKY